MTELELKRLLEDIARVRVGVVGDFCLDVYWFLDPSASESSLETGLPTQPVRDQRCSLGGAGNVAYNLSAMGCRRVAVFGVVGDDPWGREMAALLKAAGANTQGLLVQAKDWATPAYVKPYEGEREHPRMDFGNFNRLADATAALLLDRIEQAMPALDVLIINQQVRQGLHTETFRRGLAARMQQRTKPIFIVDSRHYSDAYPSAFLQINDHEAVRLRSAGQAPEAQAGKSEVSAAAEALFARRGQPVFITRGARGCLVCDAQGIHEVPAIQVFGPIDTVGAGDSLLSGAALALGAGRDPASAAKLGTLAAAVTIRKLRETGTASPAELLEMARGAEYVYHPGLAEDTRQARYLEGTEFEIVVKRPVPFRATHAIFDHDGTLSTLRQGWEEIMEPMMVRAILGPAYATADESLYRRVCSRVADFVGWTTGIQTVVQMQGLVAMVREFGQVPEADILDAAGYKRIYNEELLQRVHARLAKFHAGELALEDLTLKGAVSFARGLQRAGVQLVLASGTDQEDVVAEARALGYADLFAGGIYGSVGDVERDAKRVVLDHILADIGSGAVSGLVTFGDGPVEMRETHRRGGWAVGVASDEIRRFGLNPAKRARLIRAGADMVIPDFSQFNRLLKLMGVEP